jgi:4-alpha-glucanotransferase
MEIRFLLRFSTKPGESFSISGGCDALGNHDLNNRIAMRYLDATFWEAKISINPQMPHPKSFNYNYYFHTSEGEIVEEWGNDRIVDISKNVEHSLVCVDNWNFAGDVNNVFYTAPFKKVFFPKSTVAKNHSSKKLYTHEFKVKAPLLAPYQTLVLLGNCKAMGNWQVENFVPLQKKGEWAVAKLNLSGNSIPIEYKYGIYDKVKDSFIGYEEGNNRLMEISLSNNVKAIINDGFARFPVNKWKAAGIAIPVFSLRTENGFGVGEFSDIKMLVDWAKSTGIKLIQLLPVNDTTVTHTWSDSYPYSAISAFALHPLYINLQKVAGEAFESVLHPLVKKRQQLNAYADVDYEQVMELKLKVLNDIYQLDKDSVFASAAYKQFFKENKDWLIAYAVFSYHRDVYKTADFTQWNSYSTFDNKAIEAFVAPTQPQFDQIGWYYFTQFHLHLQLQEAHDYANANGIILKGDIPIGISRNGVDAWMQPELFFMNEQAGAPPDDFAITGQNWGFPTYNWQKMQDDGFAWWKRRFEQMNRYFDAFRIDHILGFFRIWSIPIDAIEGTMGRFYPSIPLKKNEFIAKNIPFEIDRFCKPYITDDVLLEMFGNDKDQIIQFLNKHTNGSYCLKVQFNTQVKVADYFATQPANEHNRWLKQGLFDLITNVVLFIDADDCFHFRFNMGKTYSFKRLNPAIQHKLKDLYVDYFFHRQDAFWKKEGLKRLPGLKKTTEMLICGEDLGMVPACVPEVMQQLGILSLEIQRMPKSGNSAFFNPATAPYLSVVTPSTHDMSTIRGWWEEDSNKTQLFYNNELGKIGLAPKHCDAWINKQIIQQHMQSPAMWSIFQLQDLLGMNNSLRRQNPNDERINVPAIPNYYWRYRMHITLEQLLVEEQFNNDLKEQIELGDRI